MRAIFYCFSPTGTSRAAGKLLLERFPHSLLVDITTPKKRAEPVHPEEGSIFCLLTPVYAHGIPDVVKVWLHSLPKWNRPACVICTYGSAGGGNAAYHAARMLRSNGMSVLGTAELPGPHSYDCGETRYDLRAERDWTGLETFFSSVLDKAENGGRPVLPPYRFDPARYIPQSWSGRLAYPKIDSQRCNRCNLCKVNCPVEAAGENHSACIRCAACVRRCPRGARRWRFRSFLPPLYISSRIKEKKPPRFIL
ncbi:MAG: hypothetical protein EOM52_08340 [Clostridia bacterium]|nr:hypothetical protein [Clostridia bacterium]